MEAIDIAAELRSFFEKLRSLLLQMHQAAASHSDTSLAFKIASIAIPAAIGIVSIIVTFAVARWTPWFDLVTWLRLGRPPQQASEPQQASQSRLSRHSPAPSLRTARSYLVSRRIMQRHHLMSRSL